MTGDSASTAEVGSSEGPLVGLSEPASAPVRSRRGLKVAATVVSFVAAIAAFDAGAILARHRGDAPATHLTLTPIVGAVPAASGTDLEGRPVTVSAFSGRPLLVDFFASWCGPCKRDAAVFRSVERRFHGRISLLAVAVSDTPAGDRTFASRNGWSWPIVEDVGFGWSRAFGVFGIPSAYVLDAGGRVVDRTYGRVTLRGLTGAILQALDGG